MHSHHWMMRLQTHVHHHLVPLREIRLQTLNFDSFQPWTYWYHVYWNGLTKAGVFLVHRMIDNILLYTYLETYIWGCGLMDVQLSRKIWWFISSKTVLQFTLTCACNGISSGGWTRVAYLDMTNTSHNFSGGFDEFTYQEQQFCCGSATYSTHGIEYSQVCGRVTAYQVSYTSAFLGYSIGNQLTLEGVYVDGVSITYGEPPRLHIWTAAAANEGQSDDRVCPCTKTNSEYTGSIPPFIGQDYFCDTAATQSTTSGRVYLFNPLWDGLSCGSTSTCCTFNNPPWFCKQLPEPTTDGIEVRICKYSESPIINDIEINMLHSINWYHVLWLLLSSLEWLIIMLYYLSHDCCLVNFSLLRDRESKHYTT